MHAKRSLFGNILQPDECWMLNSRLPTVGLAHEPRQQNAQRIAERLAPHPKIKKVLYPALFDDPEQARIYQAQCDYPGAMFSLDLRGGKLGAAFEFLRHLRIAQQRSLARWSGNAGVSSEDHYPFRIHGAANSPKPASPTAWVRMVLQSVQEDWRDLLSDSLNMSLEKA